ncbi:ATP-binding cassette domain-containing protein [Nocardioides sp. cx-169]|uniref:ATP-binding cassette domain-containing protein n=1 Tax=Nocardioides sp. cx-169 TaxID=2899080 RepID=UPI0022AC3213|nr:ATP-binding cassette domain-containing protein [Nocardioides sp. cx-169]
MGLAEYLGQRFAALSGGQQQRLSIALALIGRPKVAILDELSTGLDRRARREVWQLVRDIREAGTTVLLVTHIDLEALRELDGVEAVRTDAGRVVVEGAEDAALRVLAHLADQGIAPRRLRVTDGSLDSAYLDLTLRASQEDPA